MLVSSEHAISVTRAVLDAPLVRVEPTDIARLVALLEGPTSPLAQLRHAIHAHRLAGAESFTELLSLARLIGVERHGYQIETVHRVLRTLRGRALLSDEVGLGKTIEALMVLLEYQVRGMAKRVLVLAPPALVPQWVGELASKAGIAARTTNDIAYESARVAATGLAPSRLRVDVVRPDLGRG